MDKRKQKTKTAIAKAYMTAMMEHPEAPVTVTEICRRADINKTTFYRNFNDIWDLYYHLIDLFVDYVITEELIEKLLTKPSEYFAILDEQLAKLSPEMLAFVSKSVSDVCLQIEKRTKAYLKGRFGELDEVLLEFVFGALERGYLHAYGNKEAEAKVIKLADIILEHYPQAL